MAEAKRERNIDPDERISIPLDPEAQYARSYGSIATRMMPPSLASD
jgi:hypothetical protein